MQTSASVLQINPVFTFQHPNTIQDMLNARSIGKENYGLWQIDVFHHLRKHLFWNVQNLCSRLILSFMSCSKSLMELRKASQDVATGQAEICKTRAAPVLCQLKTAETNGSRGGRVAAVSLVPGSSIGCPTLPLLDAFAKINPLSWLPQNYPHWRKFIICLALPLQKYVKRF